MPRPISIVLCERIYVVCVEVRKTHLSLKSHVTAKKEHICRGLYLLSCVNGYTLYT